METIKNYNRVVLIGNGFDKALGLATSYSDFMRNLVTQRILESIENTHNMSGLFSLTFKGEMNDIRRKEIKSILKDNSLKDLLNFIKVETTKTIKYGLISDLLEHLSDINWVNIEQLYFRTLVHEFKKIKGKKINQSDYNSITQLNKCMDELTLELNNYINNLQKSFRADFINSPMASFIDNFNYRLSMVSQALKSIHEKETDPEKILFLNFNYTNTLSRFIKANFDRSKF